MLAEKRGLAKELLDGSGGLDLTELDDRELLRVVALDLRAASLAG
jgi:hypothetical protein